MTNVQQLIDFFIVDLFDFFYFGFGVFSILLFILGRYNKNFLEIIDLKAVKVISIFTTLYLILLFYEQYNKLFGIEYQQYSLYYLYILWIKHIFIFITILGLWVDKVRKSAWFRISTSILLILPLEVLFLFVTPLVNDDYLPSFWSYNSIYGYFYNFLVYGIGFTLLIFSLIIISDKLIFKRGKI